MSMNIYIDATILATSKVGKHEVRETFQLWQTATEVTKEIISKGTINESLEAYSEWCYSQDSGSYALQHINGLKAWIKSHDRWDVTFYGM